MMGCRQYSRRRRCSMHVSELDTPALVVDMDILETNIGEMAGYCRQHGLSLRPHTKTHKIPEIARMQLRSGAHGVTVAKLGEAEVLAEEGFDDILIAYPVVGAAKLERLAALCKRIRVTVALDSVEVAEGISRAAQQAGVRVQVLAEMDAGLRRCGVQSPAELAGLAQCIARLPNLDFLGFMFFPGHIRAAPPDQVRMLEEIDAGLREAQDILFRSGMEVSVVSGGSTPTAGRSHVMKTVTEIRPGTYVFNDMNTVTMGATDLSRCALTVHATVVSTSVKGRAVVDAGSKTFSSDRLRGGDGRGFGYMVEHPEVELESMTEEHGHLDTSQTSHRFKVGEQVSFIPNHVCTAVNLHNEIWGVRNGEVSERWIVAGRGRVR
jgi:D-serine deaminase-like pyridoxal phosphate-dependent protein